MKQKPRVIPQCMTANTIQETTKKVETARFTNEVEGECPVCKQQMTLSEANGIRVHVCLQDLVAMPLRNRG